MILFFGAVFTKQHTRHEGEKIKPVDYAVKTKEVITK
jgi:hypothetical protein